MESISGTKSLMRRQNDMTNQYATDFRTLAKELSGKTNIA